MDKINNIGLSRMMTSVYDYDGLTEQEIWCRIAQKINIIIEHFNYIDNKVDNEKEKNKIKFEYLLNEGLEICIGKEILKRVEDGSLIEIRDSVILKDTIAKITVIEKVVKDINKRIDIIEKQLIKEV